MNLISSQKIMLSTKALKSLFPSLPPSSFRCNDTQTQKDRLFITINDTVAPAAAIRTSLKPSKQKDSLADQDLNLEDQLSIKHSKKLEEVRILMRDVQDDPFEALVMVDALQKLCIDYHFQQEIGLILEMVYTRVSNVGFYNNDQSLHKVSLCFRILRQEGYYVPADVFENFKSNEGKFNVGLAQDVKGLMSLYEASQLSIEGEGILEEAADFSSSCLEQLMPFLDHDWARMVKNALENSYQRCSSTFIVKNFMKDYAGTSLCELAYLDSYMVKSLHRSELHQLSRWWKDLGLVQEVKLARNQLLKWYIWPMVSLIDPTLSEQRLELTKPIAFIYMIDDIFDVYGRLDELILFTEAVHRWDINTIEELPRYMRICFEALYHTTHEIACKIYKQYGFNPIDYLKDTWETLCDAFLQEAKWFASGHLPKAEEYLKTGIISSGVHVVAVHMFFLLGGGPSKESASIINDNQGIITCLGTILRLWDDLGSAKDENQDGNDGSYVTYYIKENEECSVEDAREQVMKLISDTWKSLNEECLSPNPFSATFIKASLSFARTIPLMYGYDENHSLPVLEDYIKSTF